MTRDPAENAATKPVSGWHVQLKNKQKQNKIRKINELVQANEELKL